MPMVHLNSPDWSLRRSVAPRGSRSAAGVPPSNFPREFLTAESEVADELIAKPRLAARGRQASPGALDVSFELAAGEAAVLAIRHPSGALTFHLPVQSASRGVRQPTRMRFIVTVRSTDAATGRRGLATGAVKLILIRIARGGVDKAVSLVLPKLAAAFERANWARRGLKEGWFRLAPAALPGGVLEPGTPSSPDRSLLLIHGIFSNAAAAYAPLAASGFFDRVKHIYGDRIFAFDHFSVSRTPEENARMLLEGLPEQTTKFDVVSHSRGGLVLRNLVERAQAFGRLAGRFKLGHAVLVACPNEGTPLATPQRWSDAVGWMANLLELFPDNPFTTGPAFVANGLVWLARHASGDIPGLNAMDGSGRLIADLQSPPGPPRDAYSALVANYHPSGAVLRRMIDTGVDHFFGSANDLVVPSEGGWRIDHPSAGFIPAGRIGCFGPGGNLAGDAITHVDFFARPETADFLARALAGEPHPLRRVDPLKVLPSHRLLREGKAGVASSAEAAARMETGSSKIRPKAGQARADSPHRPLRVTVVNGDLTFEEAPLLLGHYRATKLTGTERVMNELLGGAMKHSLDLGLYPLGPGTHQIFVNARVNPESPRRMPRPRAVIVAGLGEEGTLNAADLVHTVRQAVIAWAQRSTELDRKPPAFIELGAALIGSGGTGVSAAQAAQRIVQGVFEANELLRSGASDNSKQLPRVGQLHIVELYLDRATDAWRGLKMQAAATPDRYEVADEVATGIGPLPRPLDSGYRGADYDFITAETGRGDDGQTTIKYTLHTKRARSEVRAQRTQGQLLRDLVGHASNAENNDRQIGRTLFKLLIPVEMEAFLAGSGELQIELEPGTAGIPWELLDTDRDERNPGRRPWAIRAKLLRKLRTSEFRTQVTDADLSASALVIGEPACPVRYQRLLGARDEAAAVCDCLTGRGGLDRARVRTLFSDDPDKAGPDARTVIDALLERHWRIVHIAGHGEMATAGGAPGGVVLSNGTFLGPAEIATMRAVPELVFVNCCHLAARGVDQLPGQDSPQPYDRVRFAAGVAEGLIATGVRCVIAAGWAVDDAAAATFATTFYRALLRGNRFIDAVAEAREAAYDDGNNTWAAYQCYGDPDWVFRRYGADANAPAARSEDEFAGVASAAALSLTLETIVVQTKFQGHEPELQLDRVHALETRFAARWGGIGAVAELFGAAYLEARDVGAAIRWYDRAVAAGDGTASLQAVEQLANARIRLGWENVEKAQRQRAGAAARVKAAGRGRRAADLKARAAAKRSSAAAERALRASLVAARRSLREAIALLEKLVAVGATKERESLVGSAYKRLALVAAAAGRPAEERQAIAAMKAHDQRAAIIGSAPARMARRDDRE